MTGNRMLRSVCALAGTAALVWGPVVTASAQEGEPVVTNRETVQAYLNSDGSLDVARIYDQLAIEGTGSLRIENPVSTVGLRNLDGFGGYDVEDGQIGMDVDVDGEEQFRTVSDFTDDLPVTVTPEYRLDGEVVEAGDIVGESGTLEVRYTVRNVTAVPTEVTYTDGDGNEATATVDVPLPMVGQLTTVLPSSFTAVDSSDASVAGDGRGGTRLSFTMTLFPPIGSDTAEFGYVAEVEDAVLPPAEVTVVPVQPLQHPSFSGGSERIQSGAESGLELAAGVEEIDANLLRLRDGAAELLGGLQRLATGADELRAGLNDEAAPGSRELADGAAEAAAGADELSDGLNDRLAPGAGTLAAGAGELSTGLVERALPGARELESGARRLAAGLNQLAAVDGLPSAAVGASLLKDGIEQVVLPGLGQLVAGLQAAQDGAGELVDGVNAGVTEIRTNVDGPLADGVGDVHDGLAAALAANGQINRLVGAIRMIQQNGTDCTGSCQALIGIVLEGVDAQLRSGLTDARDGLARVSAGLVGLSAGLGLLAERVEDAVFGVDGLNEGLGRLEAGAASLEKGVREDVLVGLAKLESGLGGAVAGLGRLQAGGGLLVGGSAELADGLDDAADGSEELAAGADELADGADDAAAGAGELADGNDQIADGADELADGLGEAAAGSGQLADGLDTAAGSAPQIVDGASRLSDEGMSQLKAAGDETASTFGTEYAVIVAATERAETEAMPFGAPEGAISSAAYSLSIAGAEGEGGRNIGRTLGALALFGAAVGIGVLAARRGSAA